MIPWRRLRLIFALITFTSVASFGQTYQDTFNHARDLLKHKQFADALDSARQAIHLDSSHWEAWYVAGTAAVGLQKFDLAVDYFQEALTRAPEQAKGTVNAALSASNQEIQSRNQAPTAPLAQSERSPAPQSTVGTDQGVALQAGILLFATHVHSGLFECNYCDSGTLTVTRSGIEFQGSLHQFNWTREQIAQVKKHLGVVQIEISGEAKLYSFFVCVPKDPAAASRQRECNEKNPSVLATRITDVLNSNKPFGP